MTANPVPRRESSDRTKANVLIVEPHVHAFRLPFFEELGAALDAEGVRLTVAASAARPGQAPVDAVRPGRSIVPVPERSITVAGRQVTFRRLSRVAANADLVVVDQALRHLENYPLLLRQRRGPKAALWGHGIRQVKGSTSLERFVERRSTGLAHWFFAYTERCAHYVAASGFPRERITVVQNTIDVKELARLRDSITGDEERALREKLALPPRNVCLFVGELHTSKRLEFLLESCSIVAGRTPEFALVVAGDGTERGLVERAVPSRPWLRYVGRAVGREKAALGAVADILVMPGRVGLVAVDSFALKTPMITTRWPYHAPEVEYIENGVNGIVCGDSVEEFADAVERVLRARDQLARLKAACAAARPKYSLERMVANFAGGVMAALETSRR